MAPWRTKEARTNAAIELASAIWARLDRIQAGRAEVTYNHDHHRNCARFRKHIDTESIERLSNKRH